MYISHNPSYGHRFMHTRDAPLNTFDIRSVSSLILSLSLTLPSSLSSYRRPQRIKHIHPTQMRGQHNKTDIEPKLSCRSRDWPRGRRRWPAVCVCVCMLCECQSDSKRNPRVVVGFVGGRFCCCGCMSQAFAIALHYLLRVRLYSATHLTIYMLFRMQ